MSAKPNSPRARFQQEEGFLLLGVLFMILLIMIALAIAAPKMAESIRRDKEEETIHRGKQYARAVQIFFNKYGRYPNTIDQLVRTDNQRFLRKRYLDPMTGKDDWRIIHNGEQKVPTMGLFGQTVQQNGITPTGATTGTGIASPGAAGSSSPFGSSGSPGSGTSSLGSSGSGFGSSGSSFGAGSSTSPFGGNSGSAFGNSGSSTSPIGSTDTGSGSGFGSASGTGGTGTIGGTTTTGGTIPGIGGTQTTGSSGAFGSPGVTVGGAPIVGVGLLSKDTSIKIYKKQTHYNQWEFVFNPNENAVNAMVGGANVNGTTNGTGVNGSTGTGFSNSNGAGGFGNNSGSGFGSSTGSGFGSSTGSGFGSSNGSGFGSSNFFWLWFWFQQRLWFWFQQRLWFWRNAAGKPCEPHCAHQQSASVRQIVPLCYKIRLQIFWCQRSPGTHIWLVFREIWDTTA